MKTYLDCFPCFLRQALEAARMAGADEKRQRMMLDRTMALLRDVALESTPPEIGNQVHRIARQLTGNSDPYAAVKAKSTKEALRLYPRLRALAAQDGDRLEIGPCAVEALHTPGHSRGGICLLAEGHLFSGDTLFVGSVGRTDLPGASWEVLSASLREKVLSLPGSTRIWPGHDYGSRPTNLLEAERRENPFLREILGG